MDRLDKVIGYLKSNTTAERSDGDQLIQLACNCIKYADFYTGRSSKNWTARELFDGVLTDNQIKEVFAQILLKEEKFHAWLNENLTKGNITIISRTEYTRKLINDYNRMK